MATGPRVVLWERVAPATGHSLARLERTGDGWSAHGSEVARDEGTLAACSFDVVLDARWVTREVRVQAFGDDVRAVQLEADDEGRWRVDGRRRPDLDGCVDVDVAASPLTNTFPVRRLADLPVGEERTAGVAWVDVPSLQVGRVDQSYRRLGPLAWEYRDVVHGAFRFVVDDDGLVVDYEDLATRVEG